MLRESFKYLDLDWGITVPWNAITWTQMGEKDHDLDLVRERGIIPALLKPMKSLKVAVLLGSGYAWQLEEEIESHRPGVKILKGPHPSPRELIDRSPTSKRPAPYGLFHEQNKDWLWNVLRAAKRHEGGEVVPSAAGGKRRDTLTAAQERVTDR
jgi:hypothetical protein